MLKIICFFLIWLLLFFRCSLIKFWDTRNLKTQLSQTSPYIESLTQKVSLIVYNIELIRKNYATLISHMNWTFYIKILNIIVLGLLMDPCQNNVKMPRMHVFIRYKIQLMVSRVSNSVTDENFLYIRTSQISYLPTLLSSGKIAWYF